MVVGGGHRLGAARAGQLGGQLDREPRMDRRRADREEHRHRMDVEDVGGVDHEVRPAAQAGLGQRRVDGAGREDRRDRQPVEREPGSDRTTTSAPASAAATASSASRSRAALEATGPVRGGPRRVELPDPRPRRRGARRAARRGRRRSAGRGAASADRAGTRRAARAGGPAPPAGPSRCARARGRSPGS